jgi:hypothetical protein
MKIIDKTPLVDEKGELGFVPRVQAMFTYGFNWPTELRAQKAIVTFFDRQLEKGYTLIRNITLGASGITVPMILLGPTGIHVINVTFMRGRFEARGDSWNEESGDRYRPADVNLIQQTARMARAVRAFIERQGAHVPVKVEPVLIAANPGLHIESVKPSIRVLMIDGIKSFVSGLVAGEPVLRPEAVHEFTERLVNPRPPKRDRAAATEVIPAPAWQEEITQSPQQGSRARAIFDASGEARPFNPADFDFEMVDEEAAVEAFSASAVEAAPAEAPRPARPRRRFLGMTASQVAIVAALAAALLCVTAVFAYLVIFSPIPLLP